MTGEKEYDITTPFKVTSSLLPYLQASDICRIAGVCKAFHKAVEDNEGVWLELCKLEAFDVGDQKTNVRSWRDVYRLMTEHKHVMEKELVEYNERYDQWLEHRPRVACGMRFPPPPPKFNNTQNKPASVPSAFPAHPASSENCVLPFSVDLIKGSVYYLDLLIRAAKKKQFLDKYFLAAALTRYENFMHLKHKYKNIFLVPTLEIEYVWISHLLRPSMYINDCTRLFGEVIDHRIMLTNTYEYLVMPNALIETQDLYEKEFGSPYCTSLLTDRIQNLPHFNGSGVAPLDIAPIACSNRKNATNVDDTFSAPKKSLSINYAPAFVGEIGEVQTSGLLSRLFGKTDESPKVSLRVNDLKMDHMWLGEFNGYMKSAIKHPLETTEIYGKSSIYENPCHMQTKHVYQCILKAYEKFLYMAAKYPPAQGKYVHPTYAIDVIWHTHMLYPKTYATEVKEWVGYLVDHDPWPKCETKDINDAMEITNDLWQKEFDIAIDKEHVTKMKSPSASGLYRDSD